MFIPEIPLNARSNDSEDRVFRKELLSYFLERSPRRKNLGQVNYRFSVLFLKKVLVGFLLLLRLMHQFICFKLERRGPEFQNMSRLVSACRSNSADQDWHECPVDRAWLELPLWRLLDEFDINRVAVYVVLAHRLIHKHERHPSLRLVYDGEEVQFQMTSKEQLRILCCKKKRKDELIKFSFKFIRRHILAEFRKTHFAGDPNANKKRVKQKFYKMYLENDEDAIRYFESFDVSRKGLLKLKDHIALKLLIQDFQHKHYLKSLIQEYILDQNDEILTEDLTFQEFVENSLSRQHRHTMVIQGVVNSLELFLDFFTI